MNKSRIIEPTKLMTIGNGDDHTQIDVQSLPKEVRYEIETLDHIAQCKMDKIVELEILELAYHSQKLKIASLISEHLKPKNTKGNEE